MCTQLQVALYVDTVMHDCTLQIESFAEVLILTGKNVSSILWLRGKGVNTFTDRGSTLRSVPACSWSMPRTDQTPNHMEP